MLATRRRSVLSRAASLPRALVERVEPRRLLSATNAELVASADRTVEGGFALTVNFAPAGHPGVEQTRIDVGREFGQRGNGFEYGWNRDLDAAGDVVDRDSTRTVVGLRGPEADASRFGNGGPTEAQDADERFDTIALVEPGDTWSVRVPDASATYAVFFVSGDPEYDNLRGFNRANWFVNGKYTLEGRPFEAFPFAESYAFVEPDANGLINVEAAADSLNNRLAFLRVAEVVPLPEAQPGRDITWTVDDPDSPTTRAEGGKVRVDDSYYLIGGFPQGYGSTLERVDRFDLDTQTFDTSPTAMPDAAADNHAAHAYHEGTDSIYWLGGHLRDDVPQVLGAPAANVEITDTAWRYIVGEDRWEQILDLPEFRSAHGAAVVDDRLYMFGGTDETNVTSRPEMWSLDLTRLEDPNLAWDPMRSMPFATDSFVSEVVEGVGEAGGDVIVVLGGEYAHNISYVPRYHTQIYDINTATWRLGTPMPFGSSHNTWTQAEGRIWMMGHQVQALVVDPAVLSYDVAADTWYEHTPIPQTRKYGFGFSENAGSDSEPLTLFVNTGDTYQGFWSTDTLVGVLDD